jgi:hypothetical protein
MAEAKKELTKKNVKDKIVESLLLIGGIAAGVALTKLIKGKMPNEWLEPLVLIVPGAVGSLVLSDEKQRVAANGVLAVGMLDGINMAITKVPMLSVAAPFVPKLGGVDESNFNNTLLGPDLVNGSSGGAQAGAMISMM